MIPCYFVNTNIHGSDRGPIVHFRNNVGSLKLSNALFQEELFGDKKGRAISDPAL